MTIFYEMKGYENSYRLSIVKTFSAPVGLVQFALNTKSVQNTRLLQSLGLNSTNPGWRGWLSVNLGIENVHYEIPTGVTNVLGLTLFEYIPWGKETLGSEQNRKESDSACRQRKHAGLMHF